MARTAPPFPAFDEWQGMSENEQDALLDRIERARRRGARIRHFLIGLGGAAMVAGLVWAALLAARF